MDREVTVDNPAQMPERDKIDSIYEPYVKATMMVPNDYVGAVMELCQRKRGQFINMDYLDDIRVNIVYEIPLSEVVFDFFDQLKSNTKGYASFDYEFIENKESNLVKMDILLNGDKVDALSFIVHKDFAYERGKALVEKLKTLIPRQQFEVPVQAAIGQKLLQEQTSNQWVKMYYLNVMVGILAVNVSYLKTKAGKAKMKAVGSVEIPQDAF